MSKIADYEKVSDVKPGEVLLIDGSERGTKTIGIDDFIKMVMESIPEDDKSVNVDFSKLPSIDSLAKTNLETLLNDPSTGKNAKAIMKDLYYIMANAVMDVTVRRNIFRGKNLGTEVTQEQYNHIEDGTFRGLFIGDYWENTEGTAKFVIWDFNLYINGGDSEETRCKTNHVVVGIVSNVKSKMSDTSAGSYMSSYLRVTKLPEIATEYIEPFFGAEHMLSYRKIIQNDLAPGYAWASQRLDIPSIQQISSVGNVADQSKGHDFVDVQFAFFKLLGRFPKYIQIPNFWCKNNYASGYYMSFMSDNRQESVGKAQTEVISIIPYFLLVKSSSSSSIMPVEPTEISVPAGSNKLSISSPNFPNLEGSIHLFNNGTTNATAYINIIPDDTIIEGQRTLIGRLGGWPNNGAPGTMMTGNLSPGGTFEIDTNGDLWLTPNNTYASRQRFTGVTGAVPFWGVVSGSLTIANVSLGSPIKKNQGTHTWVMDYKTRIMSITFAVFRLGYMIRTGGVSWENSVRLDGLPASPSSRIRLYTYGPDSVTGRTTYIDLDTDRIIKTYGRASNGDDRDYSSETSFNGKSYSWRF